MRKQLEDKHMGLPVSWQRKYHFGDGLRIKGFHSTRGRQQAG